jgi:hypothetical protein
MSGLGKALLGCGVRVHLKNVFSTESPIFEITSINRLGGIGFTSLSLDW